MKPQLFEIIQMDKPNGKRHYFAIKVVFPLKTEVIGSIEWNYDHCGYVFSTCSFSFIGLNTLQAITQLVDDLNHNRPNQYLEINNF